MRAARLASAILIALAIGVARAASQETPPPPGSPPADGEAAPADESRTGQQQQEQATDVLDTLYSSFVGVIRWLGDLTAADWTALATILLVLVTALLGWIAHRQNKVIQAQLRAYVGIDSGGIRYQNLIEGGGGLNVHIQIRNFGQTPGYELTSWIKPPQIRPKDDVPFDDPTPIPDRGGKSMIGPHSTSTLIGPYPSRMNNLSA